MNVQRVLHIVGKMDRAGAETMLMNLYRNIDRSQIQFDFITFTHTAGDYDSEIMELGGKIIPIIASDPIKRMLALKQFLTQHPEYKIVHAHMLLSNAFHLLAAKKAGVPHRISHSHNTSNGKANLIKKIYEKWALVTNRKLATHKISCGQLAANYLFGTTKDVWMLPNAIDIEKSITVSNHSKDYINREFGTKCLKIIQVGRLNEVKNHKFSLEVATELRSCNIDFILYVIGQGPLENKLKKQVQEKSLTDHVKFLGMRTDVTELMASADYMIMPSLHEGFPVVLVESQSVGLKALVSEQVSNEVNLGLGLVEFLPINSIDSWIVHLSKPQMSKPTREDIVDSLKKHGFDAKTNAQELLRLYKNL